MPKNGDYIITFPLQSYTDTVKKWFLCNGMIGVHLCCGCFVLAAVNDVTIITSLGL